MEKVLEFFKDVKDRLSNPLFSSFILAWLVVNWKVPVGLMFYNNQTLNLDGYKSYIDLIKSNYSTSTYVVIPLLIALFYTFIFPFMRNVIMAFQSWIKTWGNTWHLQIARKGKISTERYISLREKYTNQSNLLEKVLSDESGYLLENSELKNKNVELTNDNFKLTKDLQSWQSMNDSRVLEGEYEFIRQSSIDEQKKSFRAEFVNGRLDIYMDALKQEMVETYMIQDFYCNYSTKSLCFSLYPRQGTGKSRWHILKFPNGLNELSGKEDFFYSVIYKKLSR